MSVIYVPAGRAREYAPLAANLYAGCSHGCKYCYAPAALRRDREQFHACPNVRKDVLKQFEKDAEKLAAQNAGVKVLFSFTTDPYQHIDEEMQITRKGIEILHAHGLNVEILTKGGSRARRDFDLLTNDDCFATTLTFTNDADSLKWEPGAATPADRIETIKEAHARGITTWASLEPVIDPKQSLELIRMTHEFVDLFKVGTLNHHPLSKTIDWEMFGYEAESLLKSLGKACYIKKDLREKMNKRATAI